MRHERRVNRRWVSYRIIALFLAVLILVNIIPDYLLTVSAESANDSGFDLVLSWNKNDQNEGKNTYLYDSTSRETKMVRLKLSYKNNNVTKGYEPGELIVTVPGLKAAVRSGTSYIPTAVAADKVIDGTHKYDWSYTYSTLTDTFTFTNSVAIEDKSAFEGSFEIVWELPSENTIDNFSKTLSAELITSKGEEAKSNEVTYSQRRERDEYRLEETVSPIYNTEGLCINCKIDAEGNCIDCGNNTDDYIMARYAISSKLAKKARAVDDEKDKHYDIWFPEGIWVNGEGLAKQEGKTKVIDGVTYELYSVITDKSDISNIFVAYPKDKYDNKSVKNYISYHGTYLDETEESLLAEDAIEIDLSKYGYSDMPGDMYDVKKSSAGVRDNDYLRQHCDSCYNKGAINAKDLASGKKEYNSSFAINFNYLKDMSNTYDFEFVDDIMDIELKDGSLRRLRDDEYHFTKVVIPGIKSIFNSNGLQINGNLCCSCCNNNNGNDTLQETHIEAGAYRYDLYVGNENRDKWTLVTDGESKLKFEPQEIDISQYEAAAFKLVIYDVKESFNTNGIKCSYVFHTDDSDIRTDGGRVINNMYFNLYENMDNERVWINDDFGKEQYNSDREWKRDHELYGKWLKENQGLDREFDELHIIEVPNQFEVSNKLEVTDNANYAVRLEGSISSSFILGESNELSKFSMYTIIPEGLTLSELYNTPETLMKALEFTSSDGMLSAYIEEHTTVEVIEDYKESGRTYIAFHFDFSDKPVETNEITVSGIPMYVYTDDMDSRNVNVSYTMHAAMLIDQDGKWSAGSFDGNDMENGLWSDINNDKDNKEAASFSHDTATIKIPEETKVELVKFVNTEYTDGYVNPSLDEYIPYTTAEGRYSYRLRAMAGDNTTVSKLVFFDAIETDKAREWQGEFVGVDYTAAKKLFGVEPAIKYSDKEIDFTGKTSEEILSDTSWTEEYSSNVRSIAVDFGEASAPVGSAIYIDIIMKAPENSENAPYDKITINSCRVDYNKAYQDGKSERETLNSNSVSAKFVHETGEITLVKKDNEDKKAISGAVFELYRQAGEAPNPDSDEAVLNADGKNEYEVGATGKLVVDNLEFGTYYFKEIKAPTGYMLSDELLTVTVTEAQKAAKVSFYNERKKGTISIKKISDRLKERGLSGAEFSLYEKDGTLIKEKLVSNQDGVITVDNLSWGSYYLMETKAPKGYLLSDEKISFKINAENDAGRAEGKDGVITVINEQIPASVVLTKRETLEDGTHTKIPLKGAAYELYYNNNGTEQKLGTYITDDKGMLSVDDLTFGEYYFIETVAPKGYKKHEGKIKFDVNEEHTESYCAVQTYNQRKTGNINLRKTDDNGDYVSGAVYGLFDKTTGEQIDETRKPSNKTFKTDGEGVIDITNLYWGDYYIQELEAPKGYEKNDAKYEFTVDRETVASTIQILANDDRLTGTVELTKCAENDESILLSGAVFTLYKNDGSVYRDDIKTGENGKVTVTDIEWGSYYFLEKTAPAGYGLNSQKIRFSVNYLTASKTQYFTVTDPVLESELTVAKRIKISDIIYEHGNPTFTFKVEGKDASDKLHSYYKTVSFSKNYVDSYLADNPGATYVEASVMFIGIPAGTYTVSEVETNRYETEDVEVRSGNGTVGANSAVFVFDESNLKGEAAFTNKKVNQGETSHAAAAANIINRQRKLTAVVAEYTGPETVTSKMTIDNSVLNVYAVYDDGTQRLLDKATDNYTVNPDVISDEVNGVFTVEVQYTESGITRRDSFEINVSISDVFTWKQPDNNPIYDDAGNKIYDGTAVITGYTGNSSIVRFPETVTGWRNLDDYGNGVDSGKANIKTGYDKKVYKVVAIEGHEWQAAYGMKNRTGIVLPDTLERIGYQAFRDCAGLTGSLVIPDGVQQIYEGAFMGCRGLTGNLVIPDSVTMLGKESFRDCKGFAGELTLSKNLQSIAESAFYGCGNLTGSLYIPDTVTSIGSRAFKNCSGFNRALHLPEKITSIEMDTFYNCSRLTGELTIPAGVTSIKHGAFYNCSGLTGTLTIPASVKEVGTGTFEWQGAFQGCIGFSKLIISEGVEKIGECAFMNCTGMKDKLYIPDTVTILGHRAFTNCSGFSGPLHLPEKITSIEMNTFYNCSRLTGELTIPAGVTSIKHGAFYNCSGLTGTLNIPNSVIEIGVGSYENCGAFEGCKGFTGLTLGSSIKTLGQRAFYRCTGFTGNLTIPDSVTTIEGEAFRGCLFDGELKLGSGLTKLANHAFWSCYKLKGNIKIPGGVTEIGTEAFFNCRSIDSITVPVTVTSIGTSAFGDYWVDIPSEYQSKYLKELVLPTHFQGETFGASVSNTNIIYRD